MMVMELRFFKENFHRMRSKMCHLCEHTIGELLAEIAGDTVHVLDAVHIVVFHNLELVKCELKGLYQLE